MPATRTLEAAPVERGAMALVLEPALKVAGALIAGLTVAVAIVLGAKVMLPDGLRAGAVLLAYTGAGEVISVGRMEADTTGGGEVVTDDCDVTTEEVYRVYGVAYEVGDTDVGVTTGAGAEAEDQTDQEYAGGPVGACG